MKWTALSDSPNAQSSQLSGSPTDFAYQATKREHSGERTFE